MRLPIQSRGISPSVRKTTAISYLLSFHTRHRRLHPNLAVCTRWRKSSTGVSNSYGFRQKLFENNKTGADTFLASLAGDPTASSQWMHKQGTQSYSHQQRRQGSAVRGSRSTLAVLNTTVLQSGRMLTDQAGNSYFVPRNSTVWLAQLSMLAKKATHVLPSGELFE